MIIRPRIIPVLLIDNQSLVKTIKFKNPNYLGDPINATRIFNEKAVDELCILDISASRELKGPDFKMLKDIAEEAFMPLSYGGGINSLEDAKTILKMGYEKVVFNTSSINNTEMIKNLINEVGSQSVVVSIDFKKSLLSKKCFIRNGSVKTSHTPLELAKMMQRLGVGEIILQAIDNDGMMNGYDIETIKEVSQGVSIPVIACGGASSIQNLREALSLGGASAVAAGSLFVYYGKKKAVLINYPDETTLFEKGVYYERNL